MPLLVQNPRKETPNKRCRSPFRSQEKMPYPFQNPRNDAADLSEPKKRCCSPFRSQDAVETFRVYLVVVLALSPPPPLGSSLLNRLCGRKALAVGQCEGRGSGCSATLRIMAILVARQGTRGNVARNVSCQMFRLTDCTRYKRVCPQPVGYSRLA